MDSVGCAGRGSEVLNPLYERTYGFEPVPGTTNTQVRGGGWRSHAARVLSSPHNSCTERSSIAVFGHDFETRGGDRIGCRLGSMRQRHQDDRVGQPETSGRDLPQHRRPSAANGERRRAYLALRHTVTAGVLLRRTLCADRVSRQWRGISTDLCRFLGNVRSLSTGLVGPRLGRSRRSAIRLRPRSTSIVRPF